MTNKGRLVLSAAVMTIGTYALAAAGGGGAAPGAQGGAGAPGAGADGAQPSAIINDGQGNTIGPGTGGAPGDQPAATSWQDQATPATPPASAKPPIEVRTPGDGNVDRDDDRPTPDPAPRTLPRVSQPLPPGGTVIHRPGQLDTGTGDATGSADSSTGQVQSAPGVAAPGTPPIVGAPSGYLQNRAAELQQQEQQQSPQGTQLRGGFGSSDLTVDQSAAAAGIDESQIDVTRRTQQMLREADAQPAGGQLPAQQQQPGASPPIQQRPGQQIQPDQQPQEQRPEIPMPPRPGQAP